MRELKFRAYDEQYGMLYDDGLEVLNSDIYAGLSYGKLFVTRKDDTETDWREFEVMQFTGIYDKNGKEIYEGDIVKSYCKSGGWEIDFVDFKDGRYILHDKEGLLVDIWLGDEDLETLEVIGNIYENPEILEV